MLRHGVPRQRVKNGNSLSTAAPANDDSHVQDDQRTFTCRKFLLLQGRWCIRTRLIGWIIVSVVSSFAVLLAQTSEQATSKSFPPRYVFYQLIDPDNTLQPPTVRRLDLNMELYPSKRTIFVSERAHMAQMHLQDSKDYKRRLAEPFETFSCKAQYDWQLSYFPTCNLVHEADLTNLHTTPRKNEQVRLIENGFYRDVWTFRQDFSHEKRVLKTLRYEHDYNSRNYDRHRRDAIATERLTKSDHILDIYGFCGNSGLFEYADGGSVAHLLWSDKNITQLQKLRVATQLTTAIAEMHNVDKEGRASMAHTDITPAQFILSDGIYKLNDFNRARFLLWDIKKDKPCGYHVANNPGTNRSPEEYRYGKQSEKVDIYSLGNIFYMMLTQHWPWKGFSEKEAKRRVKQGQRPAIPDSVRNSSDPVDVTLSEALKMTQWQDPQERATARQVETFLKDKLRELSPTAIKAGVEVR